MELEKVFIVRHLQNNVFFSFVVYLRTRLYDDKDWFCQLPCFIKCVHQIRICLSYITSFLYQWSGCFFIVALHEFTSRLTQSMKLYSWLMLKFIYVVMTLISQIFVFCFVYYISRKNTKKRHGKIVLCEKQKRYNWYKPLYRNTVLKYAQWGHYLIYCNRKLRSELKSYS